MSQTFKNCCTGGDAGDLTQGIVDAAESLKGNAAKIDTFTNGSETQTVNLGGVLTKSIRGLVKSFVDPMTGYVNQAANSATQSANSAASALASKNAAAQSASAANASAVQAANYAANGADFAADAASSAHQAEVARDLAADSASLAQQYAEQLEGELEDIHSTLDAHGKAIAANEKAIDAHGKAIAANTQRLDDLDWTPWGIAITATRMSHSAIVQAMRIYRARSREQALQWQTAISAARNTRSAMRQAIDIAKLYRLVEALAAGGGSGSGLVFVPN
jgi:hypothetical protein